MAILVLAICLGVLPAFIAQSKGRSFVAWWIYGAALFIVALPHSLLIKSNTKQIEQERLQSGDSRKCPFCAEIIKIEASVCRFCGRDLPQAFCTKCGKQLGSNDAFCQHCGNAVTALGK